MLIWFITFSNFLNNIPGGKVQKVQYEVWSRYTNISLLDYTKLQFGETSSVEQNREKLYSIAWIDLKYATISQIW